MNFMLNGESREIADVWEGRKMNIVYSGEQDIINLCFVRHDEWSGGVEWLGVIVEPDITECWKRANYYVSAKFVCQNY